MKFNVNTYLELRDLDYKLYCETINVANMLSINNNLDLHTGADVENTLVKFILNLKKDWVNRNDV